MTIEKINPDTIAPPHGHAQVVVATGSKLVFASGQVGIDKDEKLVGDDYRSQGHRAALNAYAAISASGATPADIVRLTVYVVDPAQKNLEELYAGLGAAAKEAGAKTTAMSLIGITGLSMPGAFVEIEATAIIA
ncbi:RidA family protein [Streptomyces boluensis]|uniref:RidA family protein n=1 Tax=Streptomyces boluensis TaxID=1775135 RepID=A0A964ULM2_9ACTN|nr:RidA family protein [Streptomyces boluensis]NBE49993.1 RidA family protein [Streptomyces boluensis]